MLPLFRSRGSIAYSEEDMYYTISQVAKKCGLSRSTILYYDRIGLFSPDKRTKKDYRLYSQKALEILEHICALRSVGLSLKKIGEIMHGKANDRGGLLRKRLYAINQEINILRKQQKMIVELLGIKALARSTCVVSKEQWVGFLEQAGLDEQGMLRMHAEFEKASPQAHQDFLESLGISQEEIRRIRKCYAKKRDGSA